MTSDFFIPYNCIGEWAGLLLAGLLLFVMVYNKPKKSFVFRYIVCGVILSVAATLTQISIVIVANNPGRFYNRYLFTFQILLFLLLYNCILFCIFSYVNMMSIVRRTQRRQFYSMYTLLTIAYIVGIAIEIASGNLYILGMDGIDLGHFTRFYMASGFLCAFFCFNASLSNRNNISRVIWHAVCLFVPTDMLLLLLQMVYVGRNHVIFSATTYVPIFALGFLLFHNAPYDELSGCQSIYALDAFINRNIGKKVFYINFVSVMVPGLENFVDANEKILYRGIEACRAIETISSKIKLFKIEDSVYVNIIDETDEATAISYINRIRGVFDSVKSDLEMPFNYLMISCEAKPELERPFKVRQFLEFVGSKYRGQNSSHFYIAKPVDYDNFAEHFEITSTLMDIKNRQDMNDERVLVYAQPIYSVDTGTFKSAEALMRLKVGERIIYPDKFITIAENTGCIHVLTCIILNKVCKHVEYLNEYYDFDAISVNCSSKEICQENMNADLMEIIERYDIDTSKIRLEITETAMFENFESANDNMNNLSRLGIQFYLDDFGTGYSSLERVMDCPFKTIKFDKTLLYKSLDDDRMDDILSYMIEVFKKNGFVTLVEGVEDESQSQYSVKHGFDYIQGYHYAKPEPIENMKKYFSRKNGF